MSYEENNFNFYHNNDNYQGGFGEYQEVQETPPPPPGGSGGFGKKGIPLTLISPLKS